MPDLKSMVAFKENDTDQHVLSLDLMTHYEFRPITLHTFSIYYLYMHHNHQKTTPRLSCKEKQTSVFNADIPSKKY